MFIVGFDFAYRKGRVARDLLIGWHFAMLTERQTLFPYILRVNINSLYLRIGTVPRSGIDNHSLRKAVNCQTPRSRKWTSVDEFSNETIMPSHYTGIWDKTYVMPKAYTQRYNTAKQHAVGRSRWPEIEKQFQIFRTALYSLEYWRQELQRWQRCRHQR